MPILIQYILSYKNNIIKGMWETKVYWMLLMSL